MKLITPFDLVEKFPELQDLAIVGNARSLLDWNLGSTIDEFPTIARFNGCALAGFEDQVGSKTDILVTHPYGEKLVGRRLDGGSCRVVLVLSPQTRRGEKEVFEKWVGDAEVLFSYTPSLVGVKDSTHLGGLTTGSYAVHLLSRILVPRRVLITGFTMFAEGDNSLYWKSGKPSGLKHHNFPEETPLFCRIINSIFAEEVIITPDVASVFERTEIRPGKRVRVLEP
jgi:hypothetical protein